MNSFFNHNIVKLDEKDKFEKDIKSDVECIDLKLKYLSEKCSQLGKIEKTPQISSSSYIDKLINEYQVCELFLT